MKRFMVFSLLIVFSLSALYAQSYSRSVNVGEVVPTRTVLTPGTNGMSIQEQIAAEKAEQERLIAEKVKQERRAAEQAQMEQMRADSISKERRDSIGAIKQIRRSKYDWANVILLNGSYAPKKNYAFGLTYAMVKHCGWYISARSNFQFPKASVSADSGHCVEGVLPYYSGKTKTSHWLVNTGFVGDILAWAGATDHRFCTFGFYLGVGYGQHSMYWETFDQQWIKQSGESFQGVCGNVGLFGSVHGFTLSAGVTTIAFKYTEVEIGIGYMF